MQDKFIFVPFVFLTCTAM